MGPRLAGGSAMVLDAGPGAAFRVRGAARRRTAGNSQWILAGESEGANEGERGSVLQRQHV